jgi:hypothetical protein
VPRHAPIPPNPEFRSRGPFSCRFSPCLRASPCYPFRPRRSIFDRARDFDHEADGTGHPVGPAGYGILFESRPLVIFGLCVMLFHFANAPLLPLVGQKLAARRL